MLGSISWSFKNVGSVDSTQSVAERLAGKGAPEGLVIIASSQTSGRGRNARPWISPEGGLYMSIVLRPARRDGVQLLPLVGAFAVADGIKKDSGIVPYVRWPNDVIIEGKKIAGIIAEGSYRGKRLSHAVIGIGVNCNARAECLGEFSQHSTSLIDQLGVEVDITVLRDKILGSLVPMYAEWERFGKIVGRRKDWISTIGRKVEVTQRGKKTVYIAEDIAEDGSIVLRKGSDSRTLRAEEMEMLREL